MQVLGSALMANRGERGRAGEGFPTELASELSSEGRVTRPGRRTAEREALGGSAKRTVH